MWAGKKVAAAVALAVSLTLMTGCGGDEKAAKAAAPTVALLKGQHLAKVAARFEYQGFDMTVGYAVFDEVTKTVSVAVRWTNPDDVVHKISPYEVGLDVPGVDSSGFSFTDQPDLPPGASADVTLVADVESNPFEKGRLVFGEDDERQVTVPLDGSASRLPAVNELDLDASIGIGDNVVHVTGGRLRSWRRDGTEVPAGKRLLEVDHEVWTSRWTTLGYEPFESLRLVGADGTILKPVSAAGGGGGYWSYFDGLRSDFEVPEDAAGTYQLWLLRRTPGLFGTVPKRNTYTPVDVTIPASALEPAVRPSDEDLPLPEVAPRPPSDGEDEPKPASARTFDLRGLEAVDAGGFVVRPRELVWDPEDETVILTAEATYLGFIGAGMFDTDPALNLNTALSLGNGRTVATTLHAPETYTKDLRTQEAKAEFSLQDSGKPSLEGASLQLGSNTILDLSHHEPSKDKKKASAAAKRLPAGVSPRIASADEVSAGAYKVKILSYRVGQLSKDHPRGKQELEITYDVTLLQEVKEPAFYFDMFTMARPDGYVVLPAAERTAANLLEVGKPERQMATFIIDADEVPERVRLALRSESQRGSLSLKGWLTTEVTIALTDKLWVKDGREIDGGAGALEEMIKDDIVDRATEAGVDEDVAEDAVENLTATPDP